tara:strand:+ start:224957 stop:225586 length:630 start_codon:yes stop_codon:yes gene_type:complete
MDNPNTPNRIHPLIAVAAIAVLVACLIGIAAMTGMLPNSNADKKSVAELQAEADQKELDAKAAADKVKQEREADRVAANKKAAQARERERANQAAAVCNNCGRVVSVRSVQTQGKGSGSGVGAVGGAVVGGLLGNQIGGGSGKTLATVAGAVGGGFAGNEIEKRTGSRSTYQVNVQMENGAIRSFPFDGTPPWHEGDRVRVVDGYLKAR